MTIVNIKRTFTGIKGGNQSYNHFKPRVEGKSRHISMTSFVVFYATLSTLLHNGTCEFKPTLETIL